MTWSYGFTASFGKKEERAMTTLLIGFLASIFVISYVALACIVIVLAVVLYLQR